MEVDASSQFGSVRVEQHTARRKTSHFDHTFSGQVYRRLKSTAFY